MVKRISRLSFSWVLKVAVLALILALPMAVSFAADPPSISSDKDDYAPGELVTLTGANWQPDETVNIKVEDDQGKTWSRNVNVAADENGGIIDQFNLPDWFVATYQVVATGETSGVATTSFTDANVMVRLAGVAAGTTANIAWRKFNTFTCSGSPDETGTATNVGTAFVNVTGADTGQRVELSAPSIAGHRFVNWTGPGGLSSTGPVVCAPGQSTVQEWTANYAVDTTPPTVTITSVTGSTGTDTTSPFAVLTNNTATVVWSANEAGSYAVKVGGSNCADAEPAIGANTSGSYSSGQVTSIIDSMSLQSFGLNAPGPVRICVTDAANNTGSATATVTIDWVPPGVAALHPVGLPPGPTDAASVTFLVAFTEDVSGVSASNFALVTTGGVTGASITGVSGSGNSWSVTVNTGSGNGTIGLNMVNSNGVSDAAGSPVHSLPYTGQTCTIEKIVSTSLTVNPATGTYGGSVNLSATLTGGSGGVAGKTINFTLNGVAIGNAQTNSSGVATLNNVSLSGINAGSYPNAVGASFAGDSGYTSSNDTSDLTVNQAPTTTTVTCPASVTYNGSPQTPCSARVTGAGGLDQSLSVNYSNNTNAGTATASATYAGGPNHLGSSDTKNFTISQATASLLYTGAQLVIIPNTLTPITASVSSNVAACKNSGTVTFSLDRNPTTGASGSYTLGSGTPSNGTASITGISTTNWQQGVYTLYARYTNDNCTTSQDEVTLTVGGAGDSANGGGWTTVSGYGRINFGFTVQSVPNTSPTQYRGQFVMVNNGKWRLKGTLSSYTKTSTKDGAVSGTGDLFSWDQTLNDGLGDWQLVQSGVSFTASFTDNGTSKKSNPDKYGQRITYADPTLPNFSPTAIKGGNLTVR